MAKRCLRSTSANLCAEEKPPRLILNESGKVSQELILACMTPIFKFLPTSELFRFVSRDSAKPPLGEFWNGGLKMVFKSRLPLSVKFARPLGYAGPGPAFQAQFEQVVASGGDISALYKTLPQPPAKRLELVDRSGVKVATITRPEFFVDSPFCDFTEGVTVPCQFRLVGDNGKLFILPKVKQFLLSLKKVTALSLDIGVVDEPRARTDTLLNGATIPPELKDFLSRLETYGFNKAGDADERDRVLPFMYIGQRQFVAPIQYMASLRTLRIHHREFRDAVSPNFPVARPLALIDVLSGLESLNIWGALDVDNSSEPALAFLTARCSRLSELFLNVVLEPAVYFAAFRAMPGLATLGLRVNDFCSERFDVASIRREDPVGSVKHLLISGDGNAPYLIPIASKFPNAESLHAQCNYLNDAVAFVSELRRGGFAAKLCSASCSSGRGPRLGPNETQTDFVLSDFVRGAMSDASLPPIIDFSQDDCLFLDEANGSALASLVLAMQRNSVTSLTLKGRVSDAVLNAFRIAPQNQSSGVKAVAWRDDSFLQIPEVDHTRRVARSFTNFTDVKITGTKGEGPLAGKQFTVRLCHAPADENPFFIKCK